MKIGFGGPGTYRRKEGRKEGGEKLSLFLPLAYFVGSIGREG